MTNTANGVDELLELVGSCRALPVPVEGGRIGEAAELTLRDVETALGVRTRRSPAGKRKLPRASTVPPTPCFSSSSRRLS